uniref:E3 ubiquitin-protein ligase Topors n=1 Tax=Timema monikensis TaxID=170555 RepID=A0A7R9HRK1_9NEOP|nr:unnamed protein product [Timema monikensis]
MMEEPRCPTPPVVQEVLAPKSPLLESPQSPDVEQPNQERSSPEPNCAICLGKLQNKSFTDSCLHQFCFTCLLEWSKVKAECPLCKQNFKSIIHNVRSIEDYDQYHLRPAEPPRNWVNIALDARAFRYRTTMLAGFRQDEARQHFARLYDPENPVIPSHRRYHLRNRNHRQLASVDFRRSIYARDLWSQPLPDVTGRYRECSPEFYRNNPTQVHRLVPWLNRELGVVLNNVSHLAVVLDLILHLITSFEIVSSEFRSRIVLYIGHNVDHFIHEFYTFASSPYDMIGFDESTTYFRNNSIAVEIPTELSSSDESAVMVISSPEPTRSPQQITPISVGIQATSNDVPGTSRSHIMSVLSDLAYNVSSTHAGGSSSNDSVIGLDMTIRRPSSIIRRVSQVDYSDNDDVQFVGYVKPRHERTPDIVTLSSGPEDNVPAQESPQLVPDSDNSNYFSDMLPSTSRVVHFLVSSGTESSFKSLSLSSSDSSGSEYVPEVPKQTKREKKYSKKRVKSKTKKKSLERKKYNIPPSSSLHVRTKTKKRTRICSVSSSSEEESLSAIRQSVKNEHNFHKENWQIMTLNQQNTDDAENDGNDNGDIWQGYHSTTDSAPPYISEEIVTTQENITQPKLRSIVIARSLVQDEPSSSSSRRRSRSSSHHSHKSKHKRRIKLWDDKKKKKSRSSSGSHHRKSSSDSFTSRSKKKRK